MVRSLIVLFGIMLGNEKQLLCFKQKRQIKARCRLIFHLIMVAVGRVRYLELVVYKVFKHNGFVRGIVASIKRNLTADSLIGTHCSK